MGEMQIGGWPSSFYFFALVGLIWSPFYFYNVYGSPDEHPTITPEEKLIISKGLSPLFYFMLFFYFILCYFIINKFYF